MKLRIKGDSLRLRLTQGEVARLAASAQITESMHLTGARLVYTLLADADAHDISARLRDSQLVVVLPQSLMQSWAKSEQVSIRGQDGPVQILVEKDFACLQPRDGEDDADAFPHPDQPRHD
ncbi:MAG: hypothetical protein OER80_01715 [Gammaproteobacteria bacterium]|nr:hypothetical protein [Gammaproteobacteria bacterium]MDH3767458.1 hypothetical protein [Gammaproteobacteria bacterium]